MASEAAMSRLDRELVEGASEVVASVEVDRQQVAQTINDALTFAIRSSPVQQFGISFGAGWLSSYLFRKVSRAAAILVGCSFLAVEAASMLGLIRINWRRLSLVMQDQLNRVPSLNDRPGGGRMGNFLSFCQRHVFISTGFTTGAIIAFIF